MRTGRFQRRKEILKSTGEKEGGETNGSVHSTSTPGQTCTAFPSFKSQQAGSRVYYTSIYVEIELEGSKSSLSPT